MTPQAWKMMVAKASRIPSRYEQGGLPDECFAPAPAYFPTRAFLSKLGVVPPLADRAKNRNLWLPKLPALDVADAPKTVAEYVLAFEKLNKLTSGAETTACSGRCGKW